MTDRIRNKLFFFLIIPTLVYSLTACSPSLVRSEQPLRDSSIILSAQQSVGQTFTSEYNGLEGIIIYIDKIDPGVEEITLHLRKGPSEITDLRIGKLAGQEITSPGNNSFKFPALKNSSHTDYYFFLEVHGPASATLGSTNQNIYLNGALYQNDSPKFGQLNFSLLHNTGYLWIGLMQEVARWLSWLFICFFLFVLPGWATLSITWPFFGRLNWLEKLGLSTGVSLAIYTLLMLIADQLKIKMGASFAWLPMVIGCIIIICQNYRNFPQLLSLWLKKFNDFSTSRRWVIPWARIGFFSLIILIFLVRFWAIRTIDVPMWGDSVHHTVIAQLILDNKGLFNSWEPYASYRSMTVQYGFSAHVALFAWITGLPSYTAALVFGQIINGLAILTLIPLAYRLSPRNSWAAAVTLIYAGLISPMPAFYVNWGRFAQLDAQTILPVAIWLTCEFLDSEKWRPPDHQPTPTGSKTVAFRRFFIETFCKGLKDYWIPALIIATLLVGMNLSSYRLAHFYVGFILAWLFYLAVSQKINSAQQWINVLSKMLVIFSFCLILFIPWFSRLAGSSLTGMVQEGSLNTDLQTSMQEAVISWSHIGLYVPYGIIFIVGIGCIWSLKRKKWDVLTLIVWIVIMQVIFLGQLINFPGSNMIQVFAIMIWLYMPVSLIIGWLIGDMILKLLHLLNNSGQATLALILIILALYGANKTRLISAPNTSNLVTRPDLRAMAWIKQQIPANAKFLVSSFRYHTITSVGADAGWWIPLLARRQNNMPPQYALVFEIPDPPNLTNKINNLVFALETLSPASQEGLQLLCKHKITHVYIGQKQVYIGPEARRLYSAEDLISSPAFQLVYRQDSVYIFTLKKDACHQ